MKLRFSALLALSLFASGLALAADAEISLPTIPELRQQLATVKQELPNKRGVSASDKTQVANAIERIESTLGDATLYSSLSQAQQTAIVNDFGLVEGVYHNRGDQRMVCERSRTIGSNRLQTTCKTAAQWEAIRVRSRQDLDSAAGRACTGPGCT